jgi:hypothetical protein
MSPVWRKATADMRTGSHTLTAAYAASLGMFGFNLRFSKQPRQPRKLMAIRGHPAEMTGTTDPTIKSKNAPQPSPD